MRPPDSLRNREVWAVISALAQVLVFGTADDESCTLDLSPHSAGPECCVHFEEHEIF
jgi:hypothetical protein